MAVKSCCTLPGPVVEPAVEEDVGVKGLRKAWETQQSTDTSRGRWWRRRCCVTDRRAPLQMEMLCIHSMDDAFSSYYKLQQLSTGVR